MKCVHVHGQHNIPVCTRTYIGECHMLANVHGLLHLPEAVLDLGPLWAHSCFPYENFNGEVLKLYHGSQHVNKHTLNPY